MREATLRKEQKDFSKFMTHILMHEPNIDTVYIDETTFHLWMQPGRPWIKRGMKVELPDTRRHSISVIGALSV